MKRVVVLFWATVAAGFAVSPATAIGAGIDKGMALEAAAEEWVSHLFQPGYNEFPLALFTAAPFLAAAVFLLFHLTAERVSPGRWAGMAGALCAGMGLAVWVLVAIRTSRSSTAGIGFLFVPFEVVVAMGIGYAAGRLVARRAG